MKKIYTIAAFVFAAFMVSCATPEDRAVNTAKELKEAVGTDSKKVDKVLKERRKYKEILSAEQLKEYNATWLTTAATVASEIASEVISAVKSCNVVKAQEVEKKIGEYKRALIESEEVAKFDEVFNKCINDPDKGLKKEDMDKFNEAVYAWSHPLEKLVVVETPVPVEMPAEPVEACK